MNIGFISLGCSKNLVDTEIMMALLKNAGHKIVNAVEKADAVIINTCGFINDAKEEAIDTIIETGKLKNDGILKYLIAAGCLSQRYGKDLLDEMPELDAVIGISSFTNITEALNRVTQGEKLVLVGSPPDIYVEKGPRILTTPPGWAYLKITEGCNNRCAYCAIPSIRGKLRSKPIEEIVSEAQELVQKGIKELILVGQDTAAYGIDLYKQSSLTELLDNLGRVKDLSWIRLMYLHPYHMNEQLIEKVATHDKVIPYLDIPIQHVSDRMLQHMNRRHDYDYLNKLITGLRTSINKLVLRTTVMVGFPGETEEDFSQLYNFIKETEFDWLGGFTFTAEEGTSAYNMDNQVSEEIKNDRIDKILKLQKKITRHKNIARVGFRESILISSQVSKNLYLGRGYYQAPEVDGITLVKSDKSIQKGSFVNAELKAVRDYDMIAESRE